MYVKMWEKSLCFRFIATEIFKESHKLAIHMLCYLKSIHIFYSLALKMALFVYLNHPNITAMTQPMV